MMEDKGAILEGLCATLRLTRLLGAGNALSEIRYLKDGPDEYAVPIFEDGSGEPDGRSPHGCFAVDVTGDSGAAAVIDVVRHFVARRL